MDLHEQAEAVNAREDLIVFIEALGRDLASRPEEWENQTLGDFLSAMGAWIDGMDDWHRNTGKAPDAVPTWRTFARILCAARIYE